MSIQRFNAPKSVLKAIVLKSNVRSAISMLVGEFRDAADAQLFREFVSSQGGLLKFAKELIGEEQYSLLRRHFRDVRYEPDYSGPKSLPEVVYKVIDRTKYDTETWRQKRGSVLETSELRKEYVQSVTDSDRQVVENVDGVLVTKVVAGGDTRDVQAFQLDREEQMVLKSVIPYHRVDVRKPVRGDDGHVLFDENDNIVYRTVVEVATVRHLRKELGLPAGDKQWDNRPVMQIFITREGTGKVELAAKVQLKLRHEYDVALKQAVDAMNAAKASGKFDPAVSGLFAAAAAKKVPWQILTDALKLYFKRQGVGEGGMQLDTGFGPWPCSIIKFPKGNFILAHRLLKDDLTDRALQERAQRVAEFKQRLREERYRDLWANHGDLPMI
jgi:hypothetical protein